MNISIPSIKQKWTHLLLPVLTGVVVAKALMILLTSKNIGALQLSDWQIAAIYIAAIVTFYLSGVKGIQNE